VELIDRLQAVPGLAPVLERVRDDPDVYAVGGAVRDLILGRDLIDVDLVVDGDAAALAHRLGDRVVVHGRFGTATVQIDGHEIDVAAARRERYAHPGALPDVEPAPIEDDLLRRDFTINTFALALGGPERGRVLSAPGADEDLDARLLRVLHARSFIDDPTRLYRMARYASRFGFEIEPTTWKLAEAAVIGGAVQTVSGDRIGAELRLLAREPDPVGALRALANFGLDEEIAPGFGIWDPRTAERALALLPPDGRRDLTAIAVASLGTVDYSLRNDMGFDAGDRDRIVAAAERAERVASALRAADAPSEIAAALNGAPVELAALAGALGPAAQARRWIDELRHVRLQIDGADLIAAGILEGPAIGRGLRAALAAKLDGRADTRERELSEALAAAG
jgi:tRNA nucleotidyltransferase (CCA-adding enzyme)